MGVPTGVGGPDLGEMHQPDAGEERRRPRLPRLLPPIREVEGSRITWRKHWLFLVGHVAKPMAAALIWLALAAACILGQPQILPISRVGLAVGLAVMALPIAFWLWWETVDWENDIYVLTDDRIIDVEKRPLALSEHRREATLDRIQNVNLTVPGPIASILGYGDVNIETAGGEGMFTFTRVMAPHEVQREIMSRVARHREMRQRIEIQRRRKEMAEWFAIYEGLRTGRAGDAAPPAAAPPTATTG